MEAALINDARFPEADRSRWLSLVEKSLAGASFEEALVHRSEDGIAVEPLHERLKNPRPVARARPEPGWDILQRVDDPDPRRANAQALEDIRGGATGLAIVFEGAPNAFGYGLPATPDALAQALDGVPLHTVHLRIDVHPSSRASIDWLVGLIGRRPSDPARLRLAFGIDPAAIFGATGRLRMSIEALQASLPQSLAHFFALGVPGVLMEADGRAYHNAGATEAQELGAMLAAAVAHLRMFEEARQPLLYAAPHIGFAVSVDQNQFMSVAKLRALRKLWTRVQESCAIAPSAASVHAETSFRMMTAKDPETNILRTTIACFAAAAGGADTVSVLPHTVAHGLPDPFARRVARNAQLILAEESHIGFVSDPAAGAGGVEALSNGLCEAAWREFQAIEAEGGILRSLAANRLQARIAQARGARGKQLAGGGRTLVGTTLYPAAIERPVTTLPAGIRPAPDDGTVFCEMLPPVRLDQMLEAPA